MNLFKMLFPNPTPKRVPIPDGKTKPTTIVCLDGEGKTHRIDLAIFRRLFAD